MVASAEQGDAGDVTAWRAGEAAAGARDHADRERGKHPSAYGVAGRATDGGEATVQPGIPSRRPALLSQKQRTEGDRGGEGMTGGGRRSAAEAKR